MNNHQELKPLDTFCSHKSKVPAQNSTHCYSIFLANIEHTTQKRRADCKFISYDIRHKL